MKVVLDDDFGLEGSKTVQQGLCNENIKEKRVQTLTFLRLEG
jgi:hypothetical protein